MHHLVNYSQIMSPVPLCLEKWGSWPPPQLLWERRPWYQLQSCIVHSIIMRRRLHWQIQQVADAGLTNWRTQPHEADESNSGFLLSTPSSWDIGFTVWYNKLQMQDQRTARHGQMGQIDGTADVSRKWISSNWFIQNESANRFKSQIGMHWYLASA